MPSSVVHPKTTSGFIVGRFNRRSRMTKIERFLRAFVLTTLALVFSVAAAFIAHPAFSQQNLSAGRPANVPAEYVVTPFGYMHPSCVVHVRQGERVGQNMLHRSDGTVENVPACL